MQRRQHFKIMFGTNFLSGLFNDQASLTSDLLNSKWQRQLTVAVGNLCTKSDLPTTFHCRDTSPEGQIYRRTDGRMLRDA